MSRKKSLFNEIGGNFSFDPATIPALEKADPDRVFVGSGEHAVYTSSGRGSISLILGELSHDRGVALLPIYTCESVITPFIARGYDIHYYPIKTNLSVDSDSLFKMVDGLKPDVVFTQSYFGFDTLRELRPHYETLRKAGVAIIEDITHSLLSRFDKDGADYYLASLRKWMGMPDGGVALNMREPFAHRTMNPHTELVNQNIHAAYLKNEYTYTLDQNIKREYRRLFYASEDLLDKDLGIYAISEVSCGILRQTDLADIRRQRKINFNFLLTRFVEPSLFDLVFPNLPEDVVPLYFPIYVHGGREEFQKFFAEADIYLPIIWPLPPHCEVNLEEESANIYNKILCIPCDQRYRVNDLKRISERLSEFSSFIGNPS